MTKVAIIMGIYNCQHTLSQSVNSLLAQTFTDWQLVMCDDGSADATFEVAKEFEKRYPEKIHVLKNEKNVGLNKTLNRCLAACDAPFIARQDADDYSHPERLAKEVEFLEAHPEYALVSCAKIHFDESGDWGVFHGIEEPTALDLVHGAPFCHPAVLMRSQVLTQIGGYSEAREHWRVEDYQLWFKFYRAGYRGANLPTILYSYKDDREAYNRRTWGNRLNESRLKRVIIKELNVGIHAYPAVVRPLVIGLLPHGVYNRLHRRNLSLKNQGTIRSE
ncbi:MAG: glycosyltransferase family 2 protein [Enterococcus sp.]